MIRIEFPVEIDRPVAEVFDYLTDPARLHEWQTNRCARWSPLLRRTVERQMKSHYVALKARLESDAQEAPQRQA